MTVRICLDCSRRHERVGPRCTTCERAHQRARDAARPQYAGKWKVIRERAYPPVGTPCPLCGIPMIRSKSARNGMTLDHEHGQVECRSCNSSHRRNPA